MFVFQSEKTKNTVKGVTHEDGSVSNHRHSDVSRESDGYHSGQRSAESNQTVDQSNQSLPSYQIPTHISLIQVLFSYVLDKHISKKF